MPAHKPSHHGPKIVLKVRALKRGISLEFLSPKRMLVFPLRSPRAIKELIRLVSEAGRLPKPAQRKPEDDRQMPLPLV